MLGHVKPLTPRVGVSAVSSPLEVGAERAPGAAQDLATLLRSAGCEVLAQAPLGSADQARVAGAAWAEAHVDAVALAVASWFEDYLALDLLEECEVPLLLWALPGMETGALCGAQQLTSVLRQLGRPYRGVFGALTAGEPLRETVVFLRAGALRGRLRRARVGIAGQRIGGMTHTSPAEIALKRVVGPRVVPLDLPNLLCQAERVSEPKAASLWQDFRRRAAECRVAEEDGAQAMRVYLALRETVEAEGLDAVTVGCYPHLMGRVCLAASLLAEEGVPFACEGDVNGAVGQLLLSLLTGQATHHADWLEPLEDGTVIFTHCGSGALSLARDGGQIVLSPVRLMNQGVCALFPARRGPVTLLSLAVQGEGYQCARLEGEALPTGMVFPGDPVRVRFAQPVEQIIDWIFAEGIAHHWAIGYGHVAAEVRAWAELCGPGLRLVEP